MDLIWDNHCDTRSHIKISMDSHPTVIFNNYLATMYFAMVDFYEFLSVSREISLTFSIQSSFRNYSQCKNDNVLQILFMEKKISI